MINCMLEKKYAFNTDVCDFHDYVSSVLFESYR